MKAEGTSSGQVLRIGSAINLAGGAISEYERLHAAVWPEVLSQIARSNIRNYSIFRMDQQLFSYLEYTGIDYVADMANMAADPEIQRWWEQCQPLQQQVPGTSGGEWWRTLPEIFHTD